MRHWPDDLDAHLAWLLSGAGAQRDANDDLPGGAELAVFDPDDGQRVFRAPLARHHRVDDDLLDGEQVAVWVRPVLALDDARCRALQPQWAARDGDELALELSSGQHARIRPAHGATLALLQRWDAFLALEVSADTERLIDELAIDSF